MVYNTQDCWVFGLCPSSGILKNTKEHNVSESRSVSETLCFLGYRTMDEVQKPGNPEIHRNVFLNVRCNKYSR
jgi:hypothetical protein